MSWAVIDWAQAIDWLLFIFSNVLSVPVNVFNPDHVLLFPNIVLVKYDWFRTYAVVAMFVELSLVAGVVFNANKLLIIPVIGIVKF